MDPVQVLISQGYPPEVARKMVESGTYDKMTNPFPTLTALSGGTGIPNQTGTGEQVPPELQPYIDQGYNLEEAAQLASSTNYSLNQPQGPEDVVMKKLQTTDGPVAPQQQGNAANLFGQMLNTAGSGVSMEQAAYGLGQALGAEKGSTKTLGIVGNVGKLGLSLGRNIASGLGQMKRSQYMQDYYDETTQKAMRDNYTPAPQAGNVNYLGGQSYGQDGGIQGETLPLKEFLKGGGFKKPGFKKLM